jgi:uncharacterized protein (UPF0332 family)
MAFAEDLLEQAQHLARREKTRPKQASLRRAVSTAYYAFFHLLVGATVANWKREGQRPELARAFEHRRMKEASGKAASSTFHGHSTVVVTHLRSVAKAFTQLQQFRNIADYDSSKQWSRTEVLKQIDLSTGAFRSWNTISKEQIAQDYLLSLLIKNRQ